MFRSFVLFLLFVSSLCAQEKRLGIAVVQDGESEYIHGLVENSIRESWTLLKEEFKPVLVHRYLAGWNRKTAQKALKAAMDDPDVALILAAGTLTTLEAISMEQELSKPVVALYLQRLGESPVALKQNKSGRKNLVFSWLDQDPEQDLVAFQKLVGFKNVAFLVDASLVSEIRPETWIPSFQTQTGASVKLVPVAGDVDHVIAQLDGVDAVYLSWMVQVKSSDSQRLIDAINMKRLPSFSVQGFSDVERGVLAGTTPEYKKILFRRAALNIKDIAFGVVPETLPLNLPLISYLVVNARTADQIGLPIGTQWIEEGRILFGTDLPPGIQLTMQQAVAQGRCCSPRLAVADSVTCQALYNIGVSRSELLPSLDAFYRRKQVNLTDVSTSSSNPPLITENSGLVFRAPILNDPALAQFWASQADYCGTSYQARSQELDVVSAVQTAYIAALRALALRDVAYRILSDVEKNLELARLRHRIGIASPEEMLRWEIRVDAEQRNISESDADVVRTMTQLNNEIGVASCLDWALESVDLAATEFGLFYDQGQRLMRQLSQDKNMHCFTNYSLQHALGCSPELAALDHFVQGQAIRKAEKSRQWVVPQIFAEVDYLHDLNIKTLSPRSNTFTDHWVATLNIEIPIYAGGSRYAQKRIADQRFCELLATRDQIMVDIDSAVRTSIAQISAARKNIYWSRRAVEASRKNLEIIRSRYSNGKATLLDLLDAQEEDSQQARLEVLVLHEYLSRLVAYQRAISWFAQDHSPEEQSEWLDGLEQFCQKDECPSLCEKRPSIWQQCAPPENLLLVEKNDDQGGLCVSFL